MDDTGIELHGARGFADGLRRLADELEDGDIIDVRREALAAARLAATLAPRRRGRLAASVDVTETPQGIAVTAGGPSVRYAGAIEYGLRRDLRSGRRRNIRPDPYMRPAIARRSPLARDAWERDVASALARQEWRD